MRGVSIESARSLRTIKQRASHIALSRDGSRWAAPSIMSRRGQLDAVIVPASRPAHRLKPAIHLASALRVPLIVLCSKRAQIDQVAKRVARSPQTRSVIVQMPNRWEHPLLPTRTSAAEFQIASANRGSGLSAKRNVGLLLARLHGWNKIAFVDDYITVSGPTTCDM